jgi:hypothetical protein
VFEIVESEQANDLPDFGICGHNGSHFNDFLLIVLFAAVTKLTGLTGALSDLFWTLLDSCGFSRHNVLFKEIP